MSGVVSFKLVLLGESSVGKSSIALRFVKDQFDDFRESTIGAAFLTKTLPRDAEHSVKFEIWDTAGQERYKSLAPMYYRNAHCAVVVYDITQESSLQNAKGWISELQRHADAGIVVALVGNKTDLEEQRTVPAEEGKKYADSEGLLFFETSAKSAQNINELFEALAKALPLERGVGAKRPAQPADAAPVQLGSAPARTEDSCAC